MGPRRKASILNPAGRGRARTSTAKRSASLRRLPHPDLLGQGVGETGLRQRFADGAVGVEIHLPIVGVVAERKNREHRPDAVELQNFNHWRRIGQHIGNGLHLFAQQFHGGDMIGVAGKLAFEFNAAVVVGRIVFDVVAQNLAIADKGEHVVECDDGGDEQPDLLHRAGHITRLDEIAHLEGLEHQQKGARREVAQQAAPRRADSDASACHQGREGGGLHPEIAQNGHDQHDVQRDVHEAEHVAREHGVEMLPVQHATQQFVGNADEPSPQNPQRDGRENFHSRLGGVLQKEVAVVLHVVHGGAPGKDIGG